MMTQARKTPNSLLQKIPSALLLSVAMMLSLALSPLKAEPASDAPKVLLGIDVLEQTGFKRLRGQRVGLLTHPAGINRYGKSTIDLLHQSPHVNLVALFGPEHGVYGNEKAEVPVDDAVDVRTGLPIYSLYGKFRKPTAKMLKDIDVLVIDLQDIGVRSYTYISCMRYAMEACFENQVEVIVLDRPNPLGGEKVDGPPMEREWMSYVGAFQMPYVHGLTIGEIARMAKDLSGWLSIREKDRRRGKLTIIPMKGWNRNMLWTDTGLPFKGTSPNIPDLAAVLGYPMTGLGAQLGEFKHGIGTPYPFRVLSLPGKSAKELAEALEAKSIPGLAFKLIQYPDKDGAQQEGVYTVVMDWDKLRPTELNFHMMQLACQLTGENVFAKASPQDASLYNKHIGSSQWWKEISTRGPRARVEPFVQKWSERAQEFKERSRPYLIY